MVLMLNEFMCKLAELANDCQDQNTLESEAGLALADERLIAHIMNHLSYLLGEDWKREIVAPEDCVRADLRKLERKLGEEFNL